MKILQRIQALGCAALMAGAISTQAQATTEITCLFDITWTGGALDGTTTTGSFTYDSMLLTGVGFEVLGPVGGAVQPEGLLDFSIDVGFTTWTVGNDIDAPDYPWVGFNDGVFAGFNFIGVDGMTFEAFGISDFDAEYENVNGEESTGFVTLVAKPPTNSVPDGGATVSLLAAGLGVITLARRKLKS